MKTKRRKIQDFCYLFPRYIEPFNNLINAGSRFQILKYSSYGIRVPRNTQAPLTLPGTLSTAGHCDQSSVAIGNSSEQS